LTAVATFRLLAPEQVVDLVPGDIVGRSPIAALCLDDPRVSEAHGMISLRGSALFLLGLRGRYRVDGKIVEDVELAAGQTIELAPEIALECLDVLLPSEVLGVKVGSLPAVPLHRPVSIWSQGRILRPGHDAAADVVLWPVGDRWRASIAGQVRDVAAGDLLVAAPEPVQLVTIALDKLATDRTWREPVLAIDFIVCQGAVRLRAPERTDVVIGGVPGRILASLLSGPKLIPWRELAEQVWPGDLAFEHSLRRRFDSGLLRLRAKLEAAGRAGIVGLDGAGHVTLDLRAEDRIVTEP